MKPEIRNMQHCREAENRNQPEAPFNPRSFSSIPRLSHSRDIRYSFGAVLSRIVVANLSRRFYGITRKRAKKFFRCLFTSRVIPRIGMFTLRYAGQLSNDRVFVYIYLESNNVNERSRTRVP